MPRDFSATSRLCSRSAASRTKIALKLGDEFPNFHVKTTIGDIELHDWIGDRRVLLSMYIVNILYDQFSSWCILFSHPADFTPVCTTELSRAAKLTPEFDRRNVKCIALSCDSIENHHDWIKVNISLPTFFRSSNVLRLGSSSVWRCKCRW